MNEVDVDQLYAKHDEDYLDGAIAAFRSYQFPAGIENNLTEARSFLDAQENARESDPDSDMKASRFRRMINLFSILSSIFLVRHGNTSFNQECGPQSPDRIRGHIDVPLDETGRKQARNLGLQLRDKGITHICSSDLSRAHETATIIAGNFRNRPKIIKMFGLRPWHLGTEIQGKNTQEVLPTINHYIDHPDETPVGGEKFNEFRSRALSAYDQIKSKYPKTNVAIVTHFRVLKLLKAHASGDFDADEFKRKDLGIPPGSFKVIGKTA